MCTCHKSSFKNTCDCSIAPKNHPFEYFFLTFVTLFNLMFNFLMIAFFLLKAILNVELTVASWTSHHPGFGSRPLGVDLQIGGAGLAGQTRLPVRAQTRSRNVGLSAAGTGEGSFVVVKSVVQLQVDELREAGLALVALVRLRARVESQVRLQVGRRAELFPAFRASMRLLAFKEEKKILVSFMLK